MKKYYALTLFAIMNIVFASLLIRLSSTGPIASGAYRLLIAIPILVTLAIIGKNNPFKINLKTLMWSSLAGAFFACDLAVYNLSLVYTTLAEANLLTNIVPFIITPFAIVFLKEKVHAKFYLALLIALVGIGLLMQQAIGNALHTSGNWLAITSACFYAMFLTSIKKATSHGESINVLMIPVSISGGLLLMLIAACRHEVLIPTSNHGWLIVLAISICGQILGQTLLALSIKHLPLQLASLFLLLSPIFAAIYAILFFQEYLSLIQWIGITIIIFAIYIGKSILQHSNKT